MGVKMSGAKEFDAWLAAIGPKGCWAARRANRSEYAESEERRWNCRN